MDERCAKYLFDVKLAIESLHEFCAEIDAEKYHASLLVRSAVERQFEIIGEALARIRRVDPTLFERIGDAEKIVGLRNIIAHGYDVVDDAILWNAYVEKIPLLQSSVNTLLV